MIRTVDDLIRVLEPYKGFQIQPRIHMEVSDEELLKRTYKYPIDSFSATMEVDDIGHSDNIVILGITLMKEGEYL